MLCYVFLLYSIPLFKHTRTCTHTTHTPFLWLANTLWPLSVFQPYCLWRLYAGFDSLSVSVSVGDRGKERRNKRNKDVASCVSWGSSLQFSLSSFLLFSLYFHLLLLLLSFSDCLPHTKAYDSKPTHARMQNTHMECQLHTCSVIRLNLYWWGRKLHIKMILSFWLVAKYSFIA